MTGAGLIRFTRFVFGRLGQKKRALKSLDQGVSRRNVAFQVGNHGRDAFNAFIGSRDITGHRQCHSNYPIQVGKARSPVEVNYLQGYRGQANPAVSELNRSKIWRDFILHISPLFVSSAGRAYSLISDMWSRK